MLIKRYKTKKKKFRKMQWAVEENMCCVAFHFGLLKIVSS